MHVALISPFINSSYSSSDPLVCSDPSVLAVAALLLSSEISSFAVSTAEISCVLESLTLSDFDPILGELHPVIPTANTTPMLLVIIFLFLCYL